MDIDNILPVAKRHLPLQLAPGREIGILEGISLMTDAVVIVDKETGVNYLFVHRGYGGGLTPLLDADGKPIITKDSYKK